jgi:hypothetical protein
LSADRFLVAAPREQQSSAPADAGPKLDLVAEEMTPQSHLLDGTPAAQFVTEIQQECQMQQVRVLRSGGRVQDHGEPFSSGANA